MVKFDKKDKLKNYEKSIMSTKSPFRKILLLGSGALKIGEAGEFDYSGSQAIKALKEEGIKVIVVNPNIATYQTSKGLADTVYFLPVNAYFVGKVIEREQPDGILLSFGGQTALNCGVELYKKGLIVAPASRSTKPKILGTPISAILKTEDRELFVKTLKEVNLLTPRSRAVKTIVGALQAADTIGYPIIIRSAYSLGGQGSAFAYNAAELKNLSEIAFSKSSQILIEEDLTGWKEIEYEVVRDASDNCITVCNMENMDPMGVHTGESIVVAPSQTLTNQEYFGLRDISIKLIKHLGVVGECNVQFALRTKKGDLDYRIIEVNARLSRSSALASKATGYPLAFIAAKLAVGYNLPELKNAVTQKTSAFFEPALDYVVLKMPRWDLDKFKLADHSIGSQMKSVGEVMAIGRNFEAALQKASRMLGLDQNGLLASYDRLKRKYPNLELNGILKTGNLEALIKKPNEHRLLAITVALRRGTSPAKVAAWSKIDPWFIYKIKNITDLMTRLAKHKKRIDPQLIREAKIKGFSDKQIAVLMEREEEEIYKYRAEQKIIPKINQIDTLAAEYPAQTNYLYLTYEANNQKVEDYYIDSRLPFSAQGFERARRGNDKIAGHGRRIMILGSGVYRIGSSVEFDWCAVTAGQMLRRLGYDVIMINHNPETVSTDYDMADKLYFEELDFEVVREIYNREQPDGVIISMGGQAPNNIAIKCHKAGFKILGTDPENIDRAEDRFKFSQLLRELGIDQPDWKELTSIAEAREFAGQVGYPVLIRPSYVLSGAAMNIAFNNDDLKHYLEEATFISPEHPVVMNKFITGAKEIELDAVALKGDVIADIISEHVENAGIHSGDATIVCPPQKLYIETMRRIKIISRLIAKKLAITGPFNIQFLAKNNDIKVIECNLRASRSFPFVSKVIGANLVEIATQAILAEKGWAREEKFPHFTSGNQINLTDIPHVGVKAPQFSFSRIKGADPLLRVEMASTGEVGAIGPDLESAYLTSILATGFNLPKKGVLLSLGGDLNKAKFLSTAKILSQHGFKIYATHHTATYLSDNKINATRLHKLHEAPLEPNIKTYLLSKKIDLVIAINDFDYHKPVKTDSFEVDDDYQLRRTAVDLNVPILTDIQTARLFVQAIAKYKLDDLEVRAWGEV